MVQTDTPLTKNDLCPSQMKKACLRKTISTIHSFPAILSGSLSNEQINIEL
jgi:hypothetical protein